MFPLINFPLINFPCSHLFGEQGIGSGRKGSHSRPEWTQVDPPTTTTVLQPCGGRPQGTPRATRRAAEHPHPHDGRDDRATSQRENLLVDIERRMERRRSTPDSTHARSAPILRNSLGGRALPVGGTRSAVSGPRPIHTVATSQTGNKAHARYHPAIDGGRTGRCEHTLGIERRGYWKGGRRFARRDGACPVPRSSRLCRRSPARRRPTAKWPARLQQRVAAEAGGRPQRARGRQQREEEQLRAPPPQPELHRP